MHVSFYKKYWLYWPLLLGVMTIGIYVSCLLFLWGRASADDTAACCTDNYLYVPFDESMKMARYPGKIITTWDRAVIDCFRTLYDRAHKGRICYAAELKIPRIIHQIWLGSSFPAKYRRWQASWQEKHPGWQYYLWTDADVERLTHIPGFFVGKTYEYYQMATNFGERSDILRLLLLYHYGGLYVDTDFEALQSCEILHHYYDFYTGMQPLDVAFPQLGFALIGAAAGHPALKTLLGWLDRTRSQGAIVARTGPVMMTACFLQTILQMPGAVIVLPASYFYPQGYEERGQPASVWQRPESFAVHHWEGSWLSPHANSSHIRR